MDDRPRLRSESARRAIPRPFDRTSSFGGWAAAVAILAYVLAFQAAFFVERLYASGDKPEERWMRWQLLGAPELLDPLLRLVRSLAWPTFLVERAPLLIVATAVWTVAVMLGGCLVRILLSKFSMTRWETRLLSAGLGIAILSLIVQILGLVGALTRGSIALVAGVVFVSWIAIRSIPGAARTSIRPEDAPPRYARIGVILAVACNVGLAVLAASLPTPDYDAHAYHLLAPKEYFAAGRITFLPHNVYAAFPFLTEMFHLLGMTVLGDWFQGGLAGQVTLAGFGLLGTGAVAILAARLFGPRAGWAAALIYATTPWVYRLTAIPYVEGAMLAFFTLGLWAASRAAESPGRWGFLSGLLAGAAIGCKYPALLMVALPLAVTLVAVARRSPLVALAGFAVGFLLVGGPWLARNAYWTGNPVYPLAYEWFGGPGWSPFKNERFVRGHQSTDFRVVTMASYARDIVTRSDWQSSLLFAFAPLALFGRNLRWAASLWLILIYLFLAFFLATHRLDRFFLAVEPIAAVLAGAGLVVALGRLGRIPTFAVVVPVIAFQFVFCATPLCGMNRYAAPIEEARRIARESVAGSLSALTESGLVDSSDGVLFVGVAAVYDVPARAYYNTVFDDNLFEGIASDPNRPGLLRGAEDVHAELIRRDIRFVFVDWDWVKRYRSPGNYGFPDFIQPAVFTELSSAGVLQPIWPLDRRLPYTLYRVLPASDGR